MLLGYCSQAIYNFPCSYIPIHNYFLHSVDCETDTEAEGFNGTRNTTALTHGTVTSFSCDSEHCSKPNFCSNACISSQTCYNGTWTGVFPTCTGTFSET